MNKKVVLSVLSATFVASMAASAFAAPNNGLYIGGNVKSHYSFDTLMGLDAAGLAKFKSDMASIGTDFNNLVYVSLNGKGASITEIMAASSLEEANKDPLKTSDFADQYNEISKSGAVTGTYDARKDVDNQPAGELKVDSVSAINLQTIVVKFGAEVTKATAENQANYTITGVTLSAGDVVLNDDKKSVTITTSTLTNNSNVRVQIANVEDKAGSKIEAYDQLLSVNDSTAPTVVSSAFVATAKEFTIKFSEPLNSVTGLVKVYDENNADVTTGIVSQPDSKTVVVDSTTLVAGKTYRVVFLGATDLADNYFAGNKVERSFKNGAAEEVKPTVSTLAPQGLKAVRVTFSEPIFVDASAADKIASISINGGAAQTVVKAATLTNAYDAVDVNGDGKTWDVALVAAAGTNLSGVHKVSLNNFKDLQANEQTTAFEQFVTFAADTTAPALVSQQVMGNKLYLTFNEDVTVPAAASSVTLLKPNSVEKAVTTSAATLANEAGNNKVVILDLTGEIDATGSYKVTFANGVLKDASNNSQAYAVTANFGVADTKKPTLKLNAGGTAVDATAIAQSATNNNIVTITFSEKLDVATALNVNNYKVDGVNVFESAVFSGDTDAVKLTLKPNALTETGTRLFTVSGVKDVAGNVMDSVTVAEDAAVKENTVPTIKTAKLVAGNKVEVTFSEALDNASVGAVDFEIKVDGAVDAGAATSVSLNTQNTIATFTLTSAVPSLTTPVTVKVKDDAVLTDVAGNAVAPVTLPVTQ
ncbi:Ig-like domain-containing protein [Brevibacillus choshinensis]|uniref:Ig-like domain-containing protein n=1 Tax=Brevibacillus choshinensis TaxID=54911 RepID=UPI002E239BEB|nr:Ig-like domain-containing protein [Brevibacillus choshinensis]